MPNNKIFDNKIAIVTGASRGIGFSIAEHLLANGCHVALLGRSLSALKTAQSLLDPSHKRSLVLSCDVSDIQAVTQTIEAIQAQLGKIDILVNNAAIASPFKLFQEYSFEEMSKLIDINLKGPMYMIRAVLPLMISAGQGDIVTINSIAGKKVYPYSSTYGASKFGVDALIESIAEEQKPNDIRFINIYPGRVYTEMWQDLEPGETQNPEEMLKVEDVSNAVLYALKQPRHLKVPDVTLLPANCD